MPAFRSKRLISEERNVKFKLLDAFDPSSCFCFLRREENSNKAKMFCVAQIFLKRRKKGK